MCKKHFNERSSIQINHWREIRDTQKQIQRLICFVFLKTNNLRNI